LGGAFCVLEAHPPTPLDEASIEQLIAECQAWRAKGEAIRARLSEVSIALEARIRETQALQQEFDRQRDSQGREPDRPA
jgi:hypothetical protein